MKSKKGAIEMSIGTIVIIVLAITMLILAMVLVRNIFEGSQENNETINYTFVLNDSEMSSIVICENYWHYELIEGLIPCVINNTIGGIGGETISWALSPQENCNRVGGGFPGLNLYNETRAKELYDELMPRCFEFNDTDVSNVWLNVSQCICLDEGADSNLSFIPNCDQYNCGGGLLINKK